MSNLDNSNSENVPFQHGNSEEKRRQRIIEELYARNCGAGIDRLLADKFFNGVIVCEPGQTPVAISREDLEAFKAKHFRQPGPDAYSEDGQAIEYKTARIDYRTARPASLN